MLLERYDNLLNGREVISDDGALLGDKIDSRKSYFRRLNMGSGSKSKSFRSGSYRHSNFHSNRPISQRVLVKAHFKKHGVGGAGGSGGAGNLRGHLSYITRNGAGIEEERPALFGSAGEDLERSDFYNLCKDDRHHFRFIISPENAHEIADMEGYIRGVMGRVEDDLGTKLEWVSAVHYDTDHPHAHVVVRGKDELGKDLVIEPHYISHGIRMRAEELATEILGERSIEEVQKSMEQETDVMRVTSLDRFIAARASEEEKEVGKITVDTREKGYSGRDEFYDGLVQKRLEFLTTTSMAVQEPPGVFTVRLDYLEELKEISERHDIIKQLHRSMPEEAIDDGVSIYKIVDRSAPHLRGEIEKISYVNEITDHKYMVVRDAEGQAHYVALGASDKNNGLREGGVVDVSAGDPPERKLDLNILDIAEDHEGVYDADTHRNHVEENMDFVSDVDGYMERHKQRIDDLVEAGLVRDLGDGRYDVLAGIEGKDAKEVGKGFLAKSREIYDPVAVMRYPKVTPLSVSSLKDKDFDFYRIGEDGEGEAIKGRIEGIERMSLDSDKRYMLLRDGNEKLHYVPLSGAKQNASLEEGAIVEISARKSKGGADAMIAACADEHGGVYRSEDHRALLEQEEKDRQAEQGDKYKARDIGGILQSCEVRIKTLEKAGIIQEQESADGWSVPKDVVERGERLRLKMERRFDGQKYAMVKVICSKPVESQIDAHARTFIDLELYRHQKDYALSYDKADKGTMAATHKRMEWLVDHGYAYHREGDGQFVMKGDALSKLYQEELETSGQKLAAVLKKPYVARAFEDMQTMRYVGFADMHSGRHVILSSADDFTLVKMPRDMAKVRVNEPVDIEQTKSGLSITTNRRDITKDEAIQLAQEKSGLSYKDMDGGEQFAATYLGAVNLEEGVFAAVAHENELSFVKLKNYPVFKDNAEIVVSAGNDGFAEIKEANRQQELELESVKELEKNKDKDVEIDW